VNNVNKDSQKDRPIYKDTLNLLKTNFGMRANATLREPELQAFWTEKKIDFELGLNNSGETFTLHDGPPYANGKLHMGHALNKVLKDIINKFQIMQGKKVCFVPGWDCHGLPIELKVLQALDKSQRAELTPIKLRKKAAAYARKQVANQMDGFKRWGIWGDWDQPYLSLDKNIFDSLLVFSLNIFILLSISKELTLALIVYATLVSSLLLFASRKLFKLNYDQLRFEADFRYGLVHVRNNAESIAFYSGETQEEKEVSRRLKSVVDNFNLLIIWEALLRVLQRSGIYGSVFIPFIILAGPILSGQMDYGSFQQANLNYNLLEGSLFFIIYKIEALARFSASIGRLEGFQSNMNEIRNNQFEDFKVEIKNNDSIILKNVSIKTPGKDNYLINNLNLSLETGQSLLVVGPSGCGKTSLLRAISGLWAIQSGEIETPSNGELLFIPQKPYMTLGSLREQLCYPLDKNRFSDEHLKAVLEEVKLPQIIQRYPDLDIKQDWQRLLSLGEQQRLAFARLLLNSPKYVVLDEATSALDVNTEKHLYELLNKREMACISVGHRPTLKNYHENVLEITENKGWRLLPAASYQFTEN